MRELELLLGLLLPLKLLQGEADAPPGPPASCVGPATGRVHGEGLGREGNCALPRLGVRVGVDRPEDVRGARADTAKHHHHPQKLRYPEE